MGKHGNGLEVVYALSGWLKSNPPSYHVRLVSGPKLAGSVFDHYYLVGFMLISFLVCLHKRVEF